MKYSDYFDIDPKYFSQVNEASIREGVDWTAFYPHETFVKLLNAVEHVLARQEKKCIWIEGAYGTGKSHAAWTLQNILTVSGDALRNYFQQYPEKLHDDLLNKLLGHKQDASIVTAHRYASSSIRNDRDLILAVQESIRKALVETGVPYKGDNTLKESVIAWIEDDTNKDYFDNLLKIPEYRLSFHEMNADAILAKLRGNGDIHDLMEKIFDLADRRSITAMNIDMTRLITWIRDIIDQNHLKALVLIWDEFSEYFKNNAQSLTEFQRLAELCNEKPFYLCIVTHEAGSLFSDQNRDWKKLRDRFILTGIALPENIAFDLIAYGALKVKDAAKDDWESKKDNLANFTNESRRVVTESARVKESVLRDMAPLHPMAALLLKNISAYFKSNQRSMFDFIKNENNEELKAFQWFIREYGPDSQEPLLTTDLLWSFFYENGKENLAFDIRGVLGVYPCFEGQLSGEEKRVLKTVLMMQAMDQKLASQIDIFKTTDKNLNLAFEGTSLETNRSVSVANKLVRDGVLFKKLLGGGREMFAAVTAADDQTQIESDKQNLRVTVKTAQLVNEGRLSEVLTLTPALRQRYAVTAVTVADFTRTVNLVRNELATWKTRAIIGFSKDNEERDEMSRLVKEAATNPEYRELLFIDAAREPLGDEAFEQYIDYTALEKYHRGKDNSLADAMKARSQDVLVDWCNRISSGQFVQYADGNANGDVATNSQAATSKFAEAAIRKYPQGFDGAQATETMFTPNGLKSGAEYGIKQETKGAFGQVYRVLGAAWQTESYWTTHASLPISRIKIKVDEFVKDAFRRDGRICIRDIFDMLSESPYGFMPCNLYAFLTGFLLKEYACDTYRWSDGDSNEPLAVDKFKEMIDECIKLKITPTTRYRDKYIVLMTPEEQEFIRLAETVFRITQNQSVESAVIQLRAKIREFGYPLWVLKELDEAQRYSTFIDKLGELTKGDSAHGQIAMEIGRMSRERRDATEALTALATREKCQEGMSVFLRVFEDGKLMRLAQDIGAEQDVLGDVRRKFDADNALWLWDRATGADRIRDLILDYEIIKESNRFNSEARSLASAYQEWKDRLGYLKVCRDALKSERPELSGLWDMLGEIYREGLLASGRRKTFLDELNVHGDALKSVLTEPEGTFRRVYARYLEGLDDTEVRNVFQNLDAGLFSREKSECNQYVANKTEEIRRSQARTQLRQRWQEKTGSTSPREWSREHKTPILCLVSADEYERAQKAFGAINSKNSDDAAIQFAMEWLDNAQPFLNSLNEAGTCETAIQTQLIGRYTAMLPDVAEVRSLLTNKIGPEAFDWFPNPDAKSKLEQEAEKRYHADGSSKAVEMLSRMNGEQLKTWLERLVRDNMTVGIEIINSNTNMMGH
jgi:hypothetical protein